MRGRIDVDLHIHVDVIVDVVGDLIVVEFAVGIEIAIAIQITVGIPDFGLDSLPGILELTLALPVQLGLILIVVMLLRLRLVTHDVLLLFRRHRDVPDMRPSSALRVPLQTMPLMKTLRITEVRRADVAECLPLRGFEPGSARS